MTAQVELKQLREAKRLLQEQVSLQKQVIAQRQELARLQEQRAEQQQEQIGLLVKEKSVLHQRVSELTAQVSQLSDQVKTLEERLAKNSHNSHQPPSLDRFARQPKSLRKSSGKPFGGQTGHQGQTLEFSSPPDVVIVHAVERCQHCHQDLKPVEAEVVERRQVVELPSVRVLVEEHQIEHKRCPHCHHLSVAPFPQDLRAPLQYPTGCATRSPFSGFIHLDKVPNYLTR
jgi:transposase